MLSISHQKGSTLIFSMIFLLILTVLAISTMSTSYLDEKMSANVQFKNQVFQEAQSEIEGQLQDYRLSTDKLSDATGFDLTYDHTADEADNTLPLQVNAASATVDKSLTLSCTGRTNVSGGALGAESTGRKFELNVRAALNNVGTASDQTQGFTYEFNDTNTFKESGDCGGI